MGTQYRVTLTKEEIEELQAICSKGTHPSRAVLCARALLLLDRGENNSKPWKLEEVSSALGMTTRTLNHLKKRFVTEGLERALNRKPQERPLLACSDPPKGYKRWTVRLLADKVVELEFTDKISPMSVQRLLKKKNLSLT